jgi:hypothetical protein
MSKYISWLNKQYLSISCTIGLLVYFEFPFSPDSTVFANSIKSSFAVEHPIGPGSSKVLRQTLILKKWRDLTIY